MKAHTLVLLSAIVVSSCAQPGADPPSASAPLVGRDKPAPTAATPRFEVPIAGLPVLGDPRALVTLVELVDYDCPYCARAEETIRALRDKYGRELRVAVVEHPLPMHEHARAAALAALAADEQGQFELVHRKLFERREPHTHEMLTALGTELRLGESFERAREGDRAKAALEHASKLVTSLRVHGTPMFFVNGRKIEGAQPMATFEKIFDEELTHARELVSAGVAPKDVYEKVLAEARANPAPFDAPSVHEPMPFVLEAKSIGGAHLLGAREAPRTIVLFADFECPYCARLDVQLRTFVKTHPEVRVVLRNRPLPMHPNARLAAKAALAAEAQGALGSYAALLFEKGAALGRDALLGHADRLGLDRARFERDLDAPETERRLAEDEALASKLEVRGTPTSFVDGFRVTGAQNASTFEGALAGKPQ